MSVEILKPEDIYGKEASAHREAFLSLIPFFTETFGHRPERFYRAPGRVEIGGNHTDHQGGVTLSAAVDLDLKAAVSLRHDGRIFLQSAGYPLCRLDLSDTEPKTDEKGTTLSLLRGMAAAFRQEGLLPAAGEGGFNACVISSVPPGSGLSSSAALEILLGTVLKDLYGSDNLTPLWLARTAQKTENDYFGKPCGLLDQISCAVGGILSVDFSAEMPWIRRIRTDFSGSGYRIFMVNSGAGHENLTEEYAAIPRECAAVAACFGCHRLCEVPEADFMDRLPELRRKLGDRAVLRAMHVYEENRRALSEALCLQKGNMEGFIRLVNASGRSSAMYLQNVTPSGSVLHQEMLVTMAVCEHALRGRGAVRVHGGGFGGTVEAFVPEDKADAFRRQTEAVLGSGAVREIQISPVGGARVTVI